MAHRARGVLRTSKQERTRLCYYSGHGTFNYGTCGWFKRHAQDRSVLGPTSKWKKEHVHMQRWNALQHSSFAAPPGSCDLLTTAGPTRQGDDTPTLTYLEKAGPAALTVRGLSRHLVWKKARLRMNSLRDPTRQGGVVPTRCCAGCGRQRSRGTAGTLETQQTCASVRA